MEARVKELRELVGYHRERYFQDDEPEVSDAEFDELFRELEIEGKFPELITHDSPTQRVGAASDTFAEVEHVLAMMSLDNAFNFEELLTWGKRIGDRSSNRHFVCEPKMDGLAVTDLRGRNFGAPPRARRVAGEDITANLSTVKSVP